MQRQAGACRRINGKVQGPLNRSAQLPQLGGVSRCLPNDVRGASQRCRSSSNAASSDTTALTIGAHPDAIRRRREAEERAVHATSQHLLILPRPIALRRARRKALERDLQASKEGEGLKWWQDSPHVATLPTPQALLELLDRAPPDRLIVVKFFSEDCYSCKTFNPKLQSIAAGLPEVTFVKINGSNPVFQAFFEATGIVSVPWFHFYKGGRRVTSMTASLNPQRLAAFRSEIAIQRGVQQPALIASASY